MIDSKFLNKKKTKNRKNKVLSFLNKIAFCFILFLLLLIITKRDPSIKKKIYDKVFNSNFSFATVNKWYKDKFGSILPLDDIIPQSDSVSVFNDKLKYSSASLYKDGVKLSVNENYLVPVIESGTVVFVGEKENYGQVIIVQQVNGIDVWYGNVNTNNIRLYDYIEKGSLLGESKDNYIYLVFQKDSKFLNYKDYI